MITRLVFDLDRDGNELAMKTLEIIAAAVKTVCEGQGITVRMTTTGTMHEVGVDHDPEVLEDDRGKNVLFTGLWKG